MKIRAPLALLALLFTTVVVQGATVRRLTFEGAVYPASVQRVIRAIEAAELEGDALVLIEMNTPGGRVDSTQELVQKMLASRVPIAIWVGPSGSHAASAGFVLLTAADLTAMAHGTRTGASTVIGPGESDPDDVGLKKANEDMAALMRSIAAQRGRDVDAAEKAVRDATSYTEGEALELGLIDRVIDDPELWIEELDGTTVRRFDGTEEVLDLSDAVFVESRERLKDRFLLWLGRGEVVYLLLMIGLAGLYFELQNPGMILPGAIGVTALVLFALGSQMLPVSWLGVALILLGLFLYALEVKVTSMGLLAVAGTVAVLAGSLMFIDSPIRELRLSLWVVLPTVLFLAAFATLVVGAVVRAQRTGIATGGEALIGALAEVVEIDGVSVQVLVHGEIWNAVPEGGTLETGDAVRVIGRDGLTLRVRAGGSE